MGNYQPLNTGYVSCMKSQLAFRSGDVIRLSMKIAAKGTKLAEDHSKKVCVGEY